MRRFKKRWREITLPVLANLTWGQYYRSESRAHRLDARVKIVVALFWAAILLAVTNFWSLLFLGVLFLLAVRSCRVPWRVVTRGLRPLLYILVFTLLVHLFFTAGPKLFSWGPLSLSRSGLESGLFVSFRLILLVMGTSLLTLTTTPIDLTDGLEFLLRPLNIVRIPSQDLAMMMGIALRFIPLLLTEADKVTKAQMARGADFATGGLYKRAKGMMPVLIPLLVAVFRQSGELASAMESRCFRRGHPRTRLRALHISLPDWFFLASATSVLFLALYIGRLP